MDNAFSKSASIVLALGLVCLFRPACNDLIAQDDIDKVKLNRVIEQKNEHGVYHVYVPSRQPKRVLVVVHGTPGKSEDITALSKKFIERWTKFAERKNLLLISPAFDRENFGADPDTGFGYGGYRGLFGRKIGADEFIINLIEQYQQRCQIQDGRFLLYGHSAGGQFTIRFTVRHPDRIAAAVACAPGRFAYPASDVPWPYGMGEFKRTIRWDAQTQVATNLKPDQQGWVQAARLPLAIVYGEQDTKQQPNRPAHTGNTRISFAQGWIAAMKKILTEPEESPISLTLIPGIGHDSAKLTKPCQKAFVRLDWIEPNPLQQIRTWKNDTGEFSIRAILVSQSATHVQLKKNDGTTITVPRDKLSAEDQSLLESSGNK